MNTFRYFFITATLLCIWQAIVYFFKLPPYLLPSPVQVFAVFYQQHELIFHQSWPTLFEIITGFLSGILLGCVSGCMIMFFRPLRFWFWPLLIISQAIPVFAIAPLLVMWLGYGLVSKIAVAAIMIFFPVASAFYDGLRRTPSGWLDLAKTMNASPWRVFWYIRIPAALPSLASGIRIAAVTAPLGAIVGEWVGSSKGLGYLMMNANARMQIDMMFASLIVIMILALLLYACVDKALRFWISWEN